jgi:hypothetical protein
MARAINEVSRLTSVLGVKTSLVECGFAPNKQAVDWCAVAIQVCKHEFELLPEPVCLPCFGNTVCVCVCVCADILNSSIQGDLPLV